MISSQPMLYSRPAGSCEIFGGYLILDLCTVTYLQFHTFVGKHKYSSDSLHTQAMQRLADNMLQLGYLSGWSTVLLLLFRWLS